MTTQQAQTAQPNRKSRLASMRGRHRLYPVLVFFLFLAYWLGAYWLERVDLASDAFIYPVPEPILTFMGLFHPKVLRHLIPLILGAFLAYQATVNLLWRLYVLPKRQDANDFLHRLRTPGDIKDQPKTITPQDLEGAREKSVRLRIGGPGKVNIPLGMVAITELNGRFNQIMNAGVHDLDRFEYVHSIVDLRPHEHSVLDYKTKTKDGFFVTADIGATYRVQCEEQSSADRPFPYDNNKVRALAYEETNMGSGKINDWTAMPPRNILGSLDGIISKLTLTDLVNLPEGNEIGPYLTVRLEDQARKSLADKNIDLIRAWVNNVKPPEEASQQLMKLWLVDEETETKLILAEGEAAVIEEIEIARAEAEFATIQVIAEGVNRASLAGFNNTVSQIAALRLIEAMEKLAVQSQDVTALPNNLIPQIHNLQNQLLLEGDINTGSGSS